MLQTSGITNVCHVCLNYYPLVDQLSYMLWKHFLRHEVTHILRLALHRSCRKQFDVDYFCQKPKKFLATQFACLTRELTFRD